jgi:collagenase-like PrtC family protease
MKNFVLPGVAEKFNVNKAIVLLKDMHPEFFYDDVNFRCFYGAFSFSVWNGGRVFGVCRRNFKEDIEMKRDFFNSRGIAIRLTMTNPLITEEHLSDTYCNLVMKMLDNGKNEVLVASPVLEKYIRENYPSFKICSSTTKCLTNLEAARKELNNKDYIQVCLDYNLNHNKTFLEGLTQEEKDQSEFLCNAICPPGCTARKEHYRINGVSTLNGNKNFTMPECTIDGSTCGQAALHYKNNITPQEIESYYEPLGFSNFKLEGRTLPDSELLLNYVRYLIKPEYYFTALDILFDML